MGSCLSALICLVTLIFGAAPQDAALHGGSVTGHVTLDGKPVPGIGVVLTKESYGDHSPPVGRAKTDRDGQFRFENLAPGRYTVVASAPGYALGAGGSMEGVVVVIGNAETADVGKIDLLRGGVITGRVTNSDGAPMVGESVQVFRLGPEGGSQAVGGDDIDQSMNQTDDRGIYRIYGLAPGRYVVAAGSPNDGAWMGSARKQYDRVFFARAQDAAGARPIDVASGGEQTGVDIVLSAASARYAVSGRVVDAETGAPISGVVAGYGPMLDGQLRGVFGYVGPVDERGEFRFDGVVTGTYGALARVRDALDYYSDTTPFEVTDAPVKGVTVKMHRGGSISGDVVVDAAGGALSSRGVRIYASFVPDPNSSPADTEGVRGVGARIESDGTFRLSGLHPGRYNIGLSAWGEHDRPLIVRVDRDGSPFAGPIEIAAGDAVAGIHVVVARGTGIILGRVSVEGGPPQNGYTDVVIRRADLASSAVSAEILAGGRFAVEGLPAGDYVVTAMVHIFAEGSPAATISGPERRVTVANGERVEVNLRVDTRPDAGGDPR